ncbi:hypothetical protein B0J13DRAFT_421309, partial [Dactylonectria estremocensis]
DNTSYATLPEASMSALSTGTPCFESDIFDATREREEQYDHWLENLRVIKILREYVRGRLERKEFVEDDEEPGPT